MKALLKLSGQVLKGSSTEVVDREYLWQLADAVKQAQLAGHQLAIVVGGGNIYRFAPNRRDPRDSKLNPTLADGRGLISIVFNGLWLKDVFDAVGVRTTLVTLAFADERFVAAYSAPVARAAIDRGDVLILAGGTGNPGTSSDVGATLLAASLGITTILKATHTVDGVYTADPVKDPSAIKLDQLTYDRALADQLDVMDRSALEQAKAAQLTTVVFSIKDPANLTKVLAGETIGSTITNERTA